MDETELEEGEACGYQEDGDTSTDPDVALSYIDEKIQNVLGHFKKDFEGLVSVENLGAKYGIYGSFLPTYRRSPVRPHSRTPPRVQNHVALQSPNIVPVEGGNPNSSIQANAPHSVRHENGSLLAHKSQSQNDLCRQTTRTQSMQSMKECTSKSELCDHKTLTVRIKVGSDNLSGKKSAAIYSGLGLEGSPLSFDDSPVESRVLLHGNGMLYEAHESPTQILQMMTSFPLYEGYLLSPLPYGLIELSERPKVLQGILTHTSFKANQENSVIGCPKDRKTSCGDNVTKLLDRRGFSLQVKRDSSNSHIGFDFLLKESDVDAVSCEDLSSDALKLPLLSSADSTFIECAKASPKEKCHSETTKREPSVSSFFDGSLSGKPNHKGNSVGIVVHNEVIDASSEMINSSEKIRNNKGEAADRSTNADTVGTKSKEASKNELKKSRKRKGKKSIPCEGGQNRSSAGDKKKPKKSKAHGFTTRNEATESGEGCAWEPKDRNCTDAENQVCRSESKNSPTQKELSEGRDKYKDFFGDLNQLDDDLMDSAGVPSKDGLKTLHLVDEATLVYGTSSRERTSSSDIRRATEAGIDHKGSSPDVGLSENGWPITDPAVGGINTHESWVCCGKCQKRRLLPPGTEVDSLPKKWICSMMNWLPDMNNCSISGEETTKALRARYQLPPENPNNSHAPNGRVRTGTAAADISDRVLPKDGKLIDKRRKTSKLFFQESPNQLLGSVKTGQHSAKDRTALDAKESPLRNELEFDQLTKSDDTFVKTNQHNKIDKQKDDWNLDGGHAKISMIEREREPNQVYPRISKKSKTRSKQTGHNDWDAAPDEGNKTLGVCPDYGFTANTARDESRTSMHKLGDNSPNTSIKSTCPGVVTLHDTKLGGSSVACNKRKTDNFQPPNSAPSSGTLISDNEHFNKKNRRVYRSKGKEDSARNGKADKRVRSMLHHCLNNTDSFRKDSSCAQPVLVATSSSSKVSGSLKAKAYARELKGSPVESVSSSPSRFLNSGKLIPGSKHILEKGEVHDVVKLAMGTPRKYSDDGCEGGSARSGHSRKDVTDTGFNNGSVKLSLIDLHGKANRSLQSGLTNVSASKIHYNGCAANLCAPTLDRCVNEVIAGLPNTHLSCSGKPCKDSSSLGEDDSDKGEFKTSEFCDNRQDQKPVYDKKERASEVRDQEKCGSNLAKTKKDIISHKPEPSIHKSKAHLNYDEMRSSMKSDAEKSPNHLVSTFKGEKSQCLNPSDGEKNEMYDCPQQHQGTDMSSLSIDASATSLSKELPSKKADGQNGAAAIMSMHTISNEHRIKNQDASSPLRRDGSSDAARNAIKEARNLKHLADRLKKSTGSSESTKFYFEAALKFLRGASLLESEKTENARHADTAESMEIYSSTAKLCEFCAREYERSKDMATAALAYKCMEVAYMRVICISHQSANKDQHELQTVLRIVPPGESPSSSASDIDSLNNSVSGGKAPLARSGESPRLAADLVITARNCPNFERFLGFAQNVNLAMEASRKSRIAFTAANISMDQLGSKEGISSVKRALDFNFHDVDGLLRLVRLAKDVTSD